MISLSSSAPPRPLPPLPASLEHVTPASFSSASQLRQLHAQFLKAGRPISDLSLPRAALVCAVSPSSDDFHYARTLLRRAPGGKPERVLWNSCLNALACSDSPLDALHLFSRLRTAGFLPDNFTCCFALKACSELGASAARVALPVGRAVHCLVEKLGFRHDVYLHNTVLLVYATCGAIADARLLFDKMPRRDLVTWNIVITRLTKAGDMEMAKELFDEMPERTVRSWTCMIGGYVQSGNPREAIRLFLEMEESGTEAPDEVTVVAVLAACADLGALDLGRRLHEYASSRGFQRNVRVCNTVIDMYVKCGCIELAREVFEGMATRSVVSWSAMICGLAMHGLGEAALELFSQMTQVGVPPNGVTFLGILHACSHMGLVAEGRRFFASMSRDYGVAPDIEHYGCMVDLLSRAGRLEEALRFIRDMPAAVAPNSAVWGALLGGARVHRNVEMGEEAIEHLRHLDPLNDGYHTVLSNIYAGAGRWEDVARVRRLMRDGGVKKTPGRSTITLGGVVHEFLAGDSDHPRAAEIYRRWEAEVLPQLRGRGYVPDTSAVLVDVDEEKKEEALHRHSEKLALTFGLMSSPPGAPVRIMKNLRVCSDCHAAFKLVSEITGRQIVVRDRNRFHCFRDGLCSCRDYW